MNNNIEVEVWKDVVGYEGIYSVSNLGRVRRDGKVMGAVVGRILRPKLRKDYLAVTLYRNDKCKTVSIHILVAKAFCWTDDIMYTNVQVNHKDGNKLNNVPANLEWVSYDGNQRHAFALGLREGKLTDEQVDQIKRLRRSGITLTTIAKQFSVSYSMISQIARGKSRIKKGIVTVGGIN